jgi:hypothetical protein
MHKAKLQLSEIIANGKEQHDTVFVIYVATASVLGQTGTEIWTKDNGAVADLLRVKAHII